ncbi:MAG: hypothetical protein LBH00_05435 [Planctomycetaceae bacterium]|nr:hypothetical protein [Planctomycetaceae bacterium]
MIFPDVDGMAKDTKQEQKPEAAPNPAAEVPAGPPKSYRMQITLGFVCLILFQMIVLWMLLPSPQKITTEKGYVIGPNGQPAPDIPDPGTLSKREPMVEKPITDKVFKVSSIQGETTVKLTVMVHVQIRKADERKFDRRYADCTNEVADQVTSTLTASSNDERNEVGHVAIKERIKKVINEVLGTPWVQSVFFTDWNVEGS